MFRIPLPFLALLAIAAVVGAAHEPVGRCGHTVSLGIVQVSTGVPGGSQLFGPNPDGVFYVDDRNFAFGNGVWLYEESNGMYARAGDAQHNLQRGSHGCSFSGCEPWDPHEICVDDPNALPDTLLWGG